MRALEVSTCLPWNVQVTHGHYPKDASRMTGGLDEGDFYKNRSVKDTENYSPPSPASSDIPAISQETAGIRL